MSEPLSSTPSSENEMVPKGRFRKRRGISGLGISLVQVDDENGEGGTAVKHFDDVEAVFAESEELELEYCGGDAFCHKAAEEKSRIYAPRQCM